MAKCGHCRKRKAKRACPALRSEICSACCGRIRNREVSCPPGCRYLSEHGPYQDRRILERKTPLSENRPPEGDDPLRDERLAWLAVQAEAPLRETAGRTPDFNDGDLILALESAKDKLVRGGGRVVLPGGERRAGSPVGEAVWQSLERCRFERSLLLEAGSGGYTFEEKVFVLDRLIAAAKSAARGDFQGRAYIERMLASFEKLKDVSRPSKLILPW
ncbi:MAG: hypothetical protein FJY82_05885 [Candidatus Aminicenantes bacterium]|nr:hypothetical protein [Candidatus Aminicenantes bacterium]